MTNEYFIKRKRVRLTEEDLKSIVRQITEGLIKSYDFSLCKTYMQRKFPNIKKIISLSDNPYIVRGRTVKANKNDFIGISLDPDNVSNFRDIISTANNMLGWFTGHIEVKKKVKTGFIEYDFYNIKGDFRCIEENCPYPNIEDLLRETPKLYSFSIILEAKFSEVYYQKPNETFYHATDKKVLHKILKQGLVPRSEGNFPDRIYLGKSVGDIKDMVGNNLNNMVLLSVDVSDLKLFKLYRDQRNPTAVFTYDNIPPSKITYIGEI